MRIGLLCWSYPPEKSGLSHAAREIAEGLAAAGHDVRVLTMDRSGLARVGGVEIIGCALEPSGPAARLRRIAGIGHLVVCARFRAAVRAEQAIRPFDAIEATNWYGPGLLVCLDPLRRGAFLTRNSTPASASAGTPTSLRGRIDLGAVKAIEKMSARRSDGMISNTAAHGERIAALYGVAAPGYRHAVIGLSLPRAFAAAGAASAIPMGSPVRLLFVGRAERRKGFDALAEALAILGLEAAAGATPDFSAFLIGITEQDLGAMPAAATSRITVRHRVLPEELLVRFGEAQIVIAPSRYESFGLVYQEAIAFGRPIVACAEDPSAREFVGAANCGLLAADCSGPALADAIRTLLVDVDLRHSLHLAARRAAGRFSRERLADATAAAYRAAGAAGLQGV